MNKVIIVFKVILPNLIIVLIKVQVVKTSNNNENNDSNSILVD